MTNIDKAIEILGRTHDGDDLSPGHLYLVECAVNFPLPKAAQDEFDKLFRDVSAGAYQKPWLFGVEHLTIDHHGYVYWKGQSVEHFTFYDDNSRQRLRKYAVSQLAPACQAAEASGNTALSFGVVSEYMSDDR